MSRLTRKQKLEHKLVVMEGEFRSKLVDALRACQAGHWGLFGQNDSLTPQSAPSKEALELLALGEQISRLRSELGIPEGFSLYERYVEYRSARTANTFGEPKLAAALLREMD